MSAPLGNKYAEKWTYEKTMDRLCAVEYSSHDDTFLYLNQVFDHLGLQDDIWAYWRRKWQRRPEVLQMMKLIMQRFEVRLFNKMAKKEIPERVAMFALKHHYGWGKEIEAKAANSEPEKLDYVDQELIVEPRTMEQPASGAPQPEAKQIVKAEPPTLLRPAGDKDFSWLKRDQYNRLHPTMKINEPLDFYLGEPPVGYGYIRFDKGYFLKRAA